MQPDDQKWLLLIDTDRSASTGDDGAELRVIRDSSAFVEHWNGSAWIDAPPSGISVRFELSSASSSWRVQLPRALFGNTAGFDFRLTFAKVVGDEIVGDDRAPDREVALRARGTDSINPLLRRAAVTPARARVGSSVLVRARLFEAGRVSRPAGSGALHDQERRARGTDQRSDLFRSRDLSPASPKSEVWHGRQGDDDGQRSSASLSPSRSGSPEPGRHQHPVGGRGGRPSDR